MGNLTLSRVRSRVKVSVDNSDLINELRIRLASFGEVLPDENDAEKHLHFQLVHADFIRLETIIETILAIFRPKGVTNVEITNSTPVLAGK